jgi:hypothetical protein
MGRHRLILAARPILAVRDWLRAHDPAYGALRRAARTALVMPAMFALADKVIANPVLATFAAFGSFAMLLLVDFSGPVKDRLLDQTALVVACAALIALATLVSRTTWLAAAVMAIIAFVVLFAGVISSVLVDHVTAARLHPPGVAPGHGRLDPRPRGRMGSGRRRLAVCHLPALARA